MTLGFFITISAPSHKILFTSVISALSYVVKVGSILLSFQARIKISSLRYAIVDFLLNFDFFIKFDKFFLLE